MPQDDDAYYLTDKDRIEKRKKDLEDCPNMHHPDTMVG